MKIKMLKSQLYNCDVNAKVKLHGRYGYGVSNIGVVDTTVVITGGRFDTFNVSDILSAIKNIPDDYEVKLEKSSGNNLLFVVTYIGNDKIVVLEDKSDCDLSSELNDRFQYASANLLDELDFFTELFETGFTIDDLREHLDKDKFEYVKNFTEEHGLIDDDSLQESFSGTPEEVARYFLANNLTALDFTIKEDADSQRSWYGMKTIDTGFCNSDIDVFIDYYGGGAGEYLFIEKDNANDEQVVKELSEKILSSLKHNEIADKGTIIYCEKA